MSSEQAAVGGPSACRASCEETAPYAVLSSPGDTTRSPVHAVPLREGEARPSGRSAPPQQLQASPCGLCWTSGSPGQGTPAPTHPPWACGSSGNTRPCWPVHGLVHLSSTPQSPRTRRPLGALRHRHWGNSRGREPGAGTTAGGGEGAAATGAPGKLLSLRTQREASVASDQRRRGTDSRPQKP